MERREFLKGAVVTAASYARVLGANERIRLGIIGPGSRGQELMREVLQAPNTEFAAVADAFNLRQQQALQIAPHATAYFDYRELLDRKDLDAVIVATPLHLHAEHISWPPWPRARTCMAKRPWLTPSSKPRRSGRLPGKPTASSASACSMFPWAPFLM